MRQELDGEPPTICIHLFWPYLVWSSPWTFWLHFVWNTKTSNHTCK